MNVTCRIHRTDERCIQKFALECASWETFEGECYSGW